MDEYQDKEFYIQIALRELNIAKNVYDIFIKLSPDGSLPYLKAINDLVIVASQNLEIALSDNTTDSENEYEDE